MVIIAFSVFQAALAKAFAFGGTAVAVAANVYIR